MHLIEAPSAARVIKLQRPGILSGIALVTVPALGFVGERIEPVAGRRAGVIGAILILSLQSILVALFASYMLDGMQSPSLFITIVIGEVVLATAFVAVIVVATARTLWREWQGSSAAYMHTEVSLSVMYLKRQAIELNGIGFHCL